MTQRHYLHLGKLLCAEYPDFAAQLTKQIAEKKPIFSAMSLLPEILNFFCSQNGITPEMVIGREEGRLSEKTNSKHIFIAVVVKLYSPSTLGPTKKILIPRLRQELCSLLNTRGDRVSRIISNARLYLNTYKDFASKVEENYTSIILNQHEFKEDKQG